MKNDRFSKKALADFVFMKIGYFEKEFGFSMHDGWNQVDGRGEKINRAYGEYDALTELVAVFNLEAPNEKM